MIRQVSAIDQSELQPDEHVEMLCTFQRLLDMEFLESNTLEVAAAFRKMEHCQPEKYEPHSVRSEQLRPIYF